MKRRDDSTQGDNERPAAGERVRIIRGQLEGLAGVVKRVGLRGTYVLAMDHWADGVLVIVAENAVERCP